MVGVPRPKSAFPRQRPHKCHPHDVPLKLTYQKSHRRKSPHTHTHQATLSRVTLTRVGKPPTAKFMDHVITPDGKGSTSQPDFEWWPFLATPPPPPLSAWGGVGFGTEQGHVFACKRRRRQTDDSIYNQTKQRTVSKSFSDISWCRWTLVVVGRLFAK